MFDGPYSDQGKTPSADPQTSALESQILSTFKFENSIVSWDKAKELILTGQVSGIEQAHNLTVTLHLKDGGSVDTTEPQIDEVSRVINACGKACQDISQATE